MMFHVKRLSLSQLLQSLQQGVQVLGAVVFQLDATLLFAVDDAAGAAQLFAQLTGGLLNIIDGKRVLLGLFFFLGGEFFHQ